jgi:hypothetical protein
MTEEKEGERQGVLERSESQLELGGIDVVKTWCVQSGNWH